MKKNKVLLIGWDAADWKLIWPLIAKGEMPALKKLMDRGVYGNMNTMNPPYSPMLWSTVATGKTPDKHGVLGFIEVKDDLKGIQPVTTNSRKAKAIWNVLHHEGYKSNLVGWWPSFPAEPINGVIVSDRFQKVNKDPRKKNPIQKGTIHPESLTKDIIDLRMFPHEITEAHIKPCIPKANEIDQEKDNSLISFAKILAENTSVHCASTYVMRNTEWDFMGIYYDLIDHFCHAFMKYHPPKQKPIPQKSYEIYKDAVISSYKIQDMMLERTMELVDDDTTIIVMSDHGFESGSRRILKMPKYPAAPALEHRQFGIFVAAGPNIKKNEKVFGLGLIDVAPTILHMFGLPIGKDMDGKVALDIFEQPEEPKYIESWEQVEGDFAQLNKSDDSDILNDQETMQQLIDLGYIEKPDEKIETAILKTQCDLKHNLARVYLGKKDFETSKELLLELINDTYPVYQQSDFEGKNKALLERQGWKVGDSIINTIPFYMDLISISLAETSFDQAEEYLIKLRKLDRKFEVQTYLTEAKILVGRGQNKKALKILQIAKSKKPNAEIWYQIGKIQAGFAHYNDAKESFENALKIEVDTAKYHLALATTLLRLDENEDAADHALTAIELVKYYPQAHYILGEALEKLGDTDNAKIAYETAARLKPKVHHRAEKALENIEEKLSAPLDFKDKNTSKYRKDQIVIVSGLPRSGTSLMMQMLHNGGLEVLTDDDRKPDQSNPKGYFEYNPVMSIHKDNEWLNLAQNKSVKVVAPLLKFLDPKYRYKVIFMNRDIYEVVKSQQKMIGKDPETLPTKIIDSFKKHLNQVEVWKDREPGVELIYLDYKDLLNNTEDAISKVKFFIGLEMDRKAMASCVDKTLYRNKI